MLYFLGSTTRLAQTAGKDLKKHDIDGAAIRELQWHDFARDVDRRENALNIWGMFSSLAGERTPLLPQGEPSLPSGWNRLDRPDNPGNGLVVFEEKLTQSITLMRPAKEASLMRMRQIEIGLLKKGGGRQNVCFLDLLSLARPGDDGQNEDAWYFDAKVASRFPNYNDDWFIKEWSMVENPTNVLGLLKDPWRIASFALRINVMSTIEGFFEWLGGLFEWLAGGIGMLIMGFLWLLARFLRRLRQFLTILLVVVILLVIILALSPLVVMEALAFLTFVLMVLLIPSNSLSDWLTVVFNNEWYGEGEEIVVDLVLLVAHILGFVSAVAICVWTCPGTITWPPGPESGMKFAQHSR
ncbi:hypothetical protein G7Y89_g8746 [Cudoniella acicularis]|uniref:Uncharacterized protein n=1 Tax=Cudoniella acicularis TaxID=354080 RepID=A0A8H4RG03_9HELO|nr:hypothetical protein G7Y89_g8746 [Cudoniella acicularis]